MSINFASWMRPVPRQAVFRQEGYHVWCGTVLQGPEGRYHMLFSRWPQELGHQGWVTHSEIGYASADNPLGPFRFERVIMTGAGGEAWDRDVVHNPAMIEHEGEYYLYYTGNYGDGSFWNHRNHQRIGVAAASHPSGPWRRFAEPLIDVSPGAWDTHITANPTVARGGDGRFYMVYKGVGPGTLPRGGAVVCGVAVADHPAGPFCKLHGPIMVNPGNDWSVEDPYIWWQEDRFYALVKDFQGYFTGTGESSVALFHSCDGIDWSASQCPLAFKREIHWEDGAITRVDALERPQLLFDRQNRPVVLYCAVGEDPERNISYNIAIPLEGTGAGE
ncbi:MAG: hypothetical protein K0R57_5546 [Paenibacillaceae bacterium]|jgi:hypothetical protein|nr:hypothetical protein [Paenibacillaceae bacterium]